MAEPQTTTEYNPLGKLLGVLALLAAGLYFTGWTYRWTYFSFFQLEVTPFGRTQFAPTLWTKSVTVGAQSLRPPIDWDIIPTQVPYFQ